jgi:hypothetical protein
MKLANYTRQERTLILLARILAVFFLMVAAGFAIGPLVLVNYIADIGRSFLGWSTGSAHLTADPGWAVPTVALYAARSHICFTVQKNPLQHIENLKLIIITAFLSTAGFIVTYLTGQARFLYLTGAVIEGGIFILTLAIYKNAVESRNRWT